MLPLSEAARQAFGEPVPYLKEFLDHEDPGEAYWRELAVDLSRWQVPTALQGGWHDGALDQTLAQYAALQASGCDASLLIGPWSHTSAFAKDGLAKVSREALAWMTERLAGESRTWAGTEDGARAPVQVYVGGSGQWRDLAAWPPQGGQQAWYLYGDGDLRREAGQGDHSRETSQGAGSSSFRYDPADPTPSAGGQLSSSEAGPQDNRAVEARPDVLLFTSQPLQAPLDALGAVRTTLHLRASHDYGHIFVRLCDVDAGGRSMNVTDGILKLRPGASPDEAVTVTMSATAYQFAAGHRLGCRSAAARIRAHTRRRRPARRARRARRPWRPGHPGCLR